MFSFKPREIRAILILSTIALIGSSFTLLKRQGRLSALDLDLFLDNGRYRYSYNTKDMLGDDNQRGASETEEQVAKEKDPLVEPEIIDLNQADFFSLQALPGVGPVLAQRIIAYRDSVGRFQSTDDLLNVPGIGERKFAAIKDKVKID
jgi:competence ComEA-like helix-hairpin-helix protein